MPDAVFRFDASPEIGYGHAMRCAALADLLGALGWRTIGVMRDRASTDGPWHRSFDRMATVDGAVDDEPAALRALVADGCDLLVVDHYRWQASNERRCRGWAGMIAVVDDLADRDHDCDVLCDSAFGRRAQDYALRVPAVTKLLLGPCYALVRQDFAKVRHSLIRRRSSTVERLFINVGATDPTGLLPKIIDGVECAGFAGTVDVVLAASAAGRTEVADRLARARFDGRLHVEASHVPELMAQADLAIGAAGGTAWERCCLGLPAIVAVVSDNQRQVAAGLAAAGAARLLRSGFSADDLAVLIAPLLGVSAEREEMSRRAMRLCDGLGCGRVAEALHRNRLGAKGGGLLLRPLGDGDEAVLLRWQREPRTRRFARDPRLPGKDEHAIWFAAKLDDPACVFHVIEVERNPAGFLRLDFDRETGSYEISIAISEAFQRRGIATRALVAIRRVLPWAALRAFVRQENAESIRLFRRAGFAEQTQEATGTWFISKPLSKTDRGHAVLKDISS
jgi:UDP-2,4-diacetamido-2,4,6-trideoxy-beta-L-altropyranose hydrolase